MARRTLHALLLTLTFAVAGRAADDDIAARRAAAAQSERDAARQIRDVDVALGADYFRLGAFIKDDLVGLKKASEAHAAIHDKVAAAYERGDDEEVKRLRTEQDKAYRARIVWRERITDWRNRQFLAAPSEQWFQEYSRWYRTGIPELMAWAEARKAAAEAWGRVADAYVPGYDPDAMEALKEAAYALDVEREIGEMRYNWMRERAAVMPADGKVSSPELTRRVEELKRLQEERIVLKRSEGERERAVRRLDRKIREADHQFRKAHDVAQREAVERARNAPKK
jgi:hypothetical protein